MTPSVHVNLTGGEGWIITASVAVIVTCLALLGLRVYEAQVYLTEWDDTRSDADEGARGVQRHDEELEEIRVYLAAAADTDELPAVRTDTSEAAEVLLAHWGDGLKPRPTPYPRQGAPGRHVAP